MGPDPPSFSQQLPVHELALKRCRLRVIEALRGKQRMHLELIARLCPGPLYRNEIDAFGDNVEKYDKEVVVPALEGCAKSECQELCDKIYATFPREVRDVIYFHLCPPRVWFNNMPQTYRYSAYVPRGFDPYVGFENGQPWQPSYVGIAFFCEFMEQFYRTTEFFFETEDPQAVQRVLTEDLWWSALDPKENLINVTFSVFANEVADPSNDESSPAQGGVFAILHSFLELRKSAKICIDFTAYKIYQTRVSRIEALGAAMDVLFPAIMELHAAGFPIRATLDYGEIKMHENLGSLTLEEWKIMLDKLVVGGR